MTTLNDNLWDVLDKIHLGDFFEIHNIPPLVFPLAVLIIIALVVFSMGSPSGGAIDCGNGICGSGENATICPADCGASVANDSIETPISSKIYVRISGGSDCPDFTVSLKGNGGKTIGSPKYTESGGVLTFEDVSEKEVYAEVSSTGGTGGSTSSEKIDTAKESVITVRIPSDYCKKETPVEPETGEIEVVIKDSDDGSAVSGTISLFDNDGSKIRSVEAYGSTTFTGLEVNQFYYFTVVADGYREYRGNSEKIYLEKNRNEKKTVLLGRIEVDTTGKFQVCVSTEDGDDVPNSGEVEITGIDNNKINSKFLSGFEDAGEGKVCNTFILDVGPQYYAQVARAPSGCSISEREGPVTLSEGQTESIELEIDCSLIGQIRAVVLNSSNDAVTDSCLVDLFYENHTKIMTMETDPDDEDYTEYATLSGGDKVYFTVKEVPEGYLNTKTRDIEIKGEENMTVKIDLDVPPPPPPIMKLKNPTMLGNMFRVGDDINITIDEINLYETPEEGGELIKENLTNEDGVTVTCTGFWGGHTQGVYNGSDWLCNLTAPEETGNGIVEIKAKRDETKDAGFAFDCMIVGEDEGLLNIELDNENSKGTSPLTIAFLVNAEDEDGETVTVDELYFSNLTVVPRFKLSNAVLENEPFVSKELSGSNGRFKASGIYVPFAGPYEWELNASAVLNGTVYTTTANGQFRVNTGTPPTISCELDPEIFNSSSETELEAELEFRNKPFTNQTINYQVISGARKGDLLIIRDTDYDEDLEKYKITTVLDHFGECKHTLNCSLNLDPKIANIRSNWVYDDHAKFVYTDTSGIDSNDCDIYDCSSLDDVAACYLNAQGVLGPNPYGSVINCAYEVMKDCKEYVPEDEEGRLQLAGVDCHQPLELTSNESESKVVITKGTRSSEGEETTINIGDVFGGEATLEKIKVPGVRTPEYITTSFITDTNAIDVTGLNNQLLSLTPRCRMLCDVMGEETTSGNLNFDNVVDDTDHEMIKALVDAVDLMGQGVYDEFMECADFDGDGKITKNDELCLTGQVPACQYNSCEEMNTEDGTTDKNYAYEICNDGVDNNCDGQTDRDTDKLDIPEESNFYNKENDIIEDVCSCTQNTPCELLKISNDINHPIGPNDDDFVESNLLRCAHIDGIDENGEYSWHSFADWCGGCGSESSIGNNLSCGDEEYTCTNSGGTYQWVNENSEIYPSNREGSDECSTAHSASCGVNQAVKTIQCLSDDPHDGCKTGPYGLICEDLPTGVEWKEITKKGMDTNGYVLCGPGSVLVGYDNNDEETPWSCAKLNYYTLDYRYGTSQAGPVISCDVIDPESQGYVYSLMAGAGDDHTQMRLYCAKATYDERDSCLVNGVCTWKNAGKTSSTTLPICSSFFGVNLGGSCEDGGAKCMQATDDGTYLYECSSDNACDSQECIWTISDSNTVASDTCQSLNVNLNDECNEEGKKCISDNQGHPVYECTVPTAGVGCQYNLEDNCDEAMYECELGEYYWEDGKKICWNGKIIGLNNGEVTHSYGGYIYSRPETSAWECGGNGDNSDFYPVCKTDYAPPSVILEYSDDGLECAIGNKAEGVEYSARFYKDGDAVGAKKEFGDNGVVLLENEDLELGDWYCNVSTQDISKKSNIVSIEYLHTECGPGYTPIESCNELMKIGNDNAYPKDGKYCLTKSFSCENTEIKQIILDNGGRLDGNYYSISDITIDKPGSSYWGLFRKLDHGSAIRDLRLKDITITGSSFAGALAAQLIDSTLENITCENCDISGSRNYVGGLVGQSIRSEIKSVKMDSQGSVSGSAYVGGIAGSSEGQDTTIRTAYNYAPVTGTTQVGGIVGYTNDASIRNTHNFATISGTSIRLGGIVGYGINSVIEDSHVGDTTITGNSNHIGGITGDLRGSKSNLTDCSSSADVLGNTASSLYVGGIVGYLESATMKNCVSDAENVKGDSKVGGFVGQALAATMEVNSDDCDALNGITVEGSSYKGQFIGYDRGGNTIINPCDSSAW